MRITKRVDLNLGYGCNLNCRFCYYQVSMRSQDRRSRKELSTSEAKNWIRFFYNNGIREIDLTGGEPSIRKDISELIHYCRETGYQKICLITNGVALSNRRFCRDLVNNGLNDILFSLHGHNNFTHDRQTRTRGSFRALVRAMENMTELGLQCRSNTVVNALSYTHLEEIASILLQHGIGRMNLILFNPVIEAQYSGNAVQMSYQNAVPYLKAVLDGYRTIFKGITIRYIPFCLMPGYEDVIVNCPQSQYDPYEWDYYLSARFRRNILLWGGALSAGLFFHPHPARLLHLDAASAKREAIMWSIISRSKTRGSQCKKCRFYGICDGLWRTYAKNVGFQELKAIPGIPVFDPVFFMRHNPQYQES